MTLFGAIGFLNPWLLTGLLALPVIWWLLRFTPPRPRQVVFPPTRLLLDLKDEQQTAEKSPWWLTLLRMLLAALVILALARPILNPERDMLAGNGPVLVVVDNGWASASQWEKMKTMLLAVISRAERDNRPVIVAATAQQSAPSIRPVSAEAAREAAEGLQPQPYAPARGKLAEALSSTLAGAGDLGAVWLSDGLDYGDAEAFSDTLTRLASAGLTVARPDEASSPLGLRASLSEGGALSAHVIRASGGTREGHVQALSSRGEQIGRAPFRFEGRAPHTVTAFDLPLEIRNQVARIAIEGEASAGAVHLLDARSQWRRIGVISGETRELAQPLLSPTYYVERALAPFAEIVAPKDSNIAETLNDLFARNLSVLVLADIGKLLPDIEDEIRSWVERGGTLLRFAGPRLEKGSDTLLPGPLRHGGRTLGGALSWSAPQPLAAFDESSPFRGLAIPADVAIRRQVLTDPAASSDAEVWARLKDGTPLVSAARSGNGSIVLFHVTANSDWSNLPMSGLFVEMLRRIAERSVSTPGRKDGPATPAAGNAAQEQPQTNVLAPVQVLDGYGRLVTPAASVAPIRSDEIDRLRPGPTRPPGYYGPAGATRAFNLIEASTVLKPLPALGAAVSIAGYGLQEALPLAPWMLVAAAALFLLDMLAVLLLAAGAPVQGLFRRARGAMPLVAFALAVSLPAIALAQSSPGQDQRDLEAALKTRLAYVVTGDTEIDRASQSGLAGLGKVLAARTAIEPAEPAGVDIETDELAFYPLLYWPVRSDARRLPDATLARIDAYMKQGGMIVFDTRDYQVSLPSGPGTTQGPSATALARLLGNLDIPALEPVPEKHVLTKSFYLLSTFPGRWDGGQMWVESVPADEDRGQRTNRSDGVSSILVTSNDLAGAWALDEHNRPIYPAVPGGEVQREMAFRVGVNIVMYALTGNYKADQVHVPALLERLGQ
ncbi:MAG: DUF4159 domain-containing protein [Hyphomicrobiales bacterium]